MLYIQALELVSKEVAINLLEHYVIYSGFSAGRQRSVNQLVGIPRGIYSGFRAG